MRGPDDRFRCVAADGAGRKAFGCSIASAHLGWQRLGLRRTGSPGALRSAPAAYGAGDHLGSPHPRRAAGRPGSAALRLLIAFNTPQAGHAGRSQCNRMLDCNIGSRRSPVVNTHLRRDPGGHIDNLYAVASVGWPGASLTPGILPPPGRARASIRHAPTGSPSPM
jgi:hypothetical protein